jgi:hypothetical protein
VKKLSIPVPVAEVGGAENASSEVDVVLTPPSVPKSAPRMIRPGAGLGGAAVGGGQDLGLDSKTEEAGPEKKSLLGGLGFSSKKKKKIELSIIYLFLMFYYSEVNEKEREKI